MIRIGLYGRPTCAALIAVAAMATAAGARSAWRDPKYHKPEETSKEDFDAVVIDPDAPNAVQVGKTFSQLKRDVEVFSAHELQGIADFLDVELPGSMALDSEEREAELQRLEEETRERAAAEQQAARDEAEGAERDRIADEQKKAEEASAGSNGTPLEEIGYPALKKLAKQVGLALGANPKGEKIIAALKDKGIITVAAEDLAALTAE